MTAIRSTMHHRSSRCYAEACSYARISMIMDAAIILVVSIFAVCLISLRLWTFA